jgi:transcriptional regulator with XRE-family HTH domain
MELRHRVLRARRHKGMSQEDLARAVGVSVNTVARFERGEIHDLRAQILKKIAQTLEVSADWLLGMSADDEDEEALVYA